MRNLPHLIIFTEEPIVHTLFCLVSGITIDYGTMWEQYAQLVDMHQHGTFWENAATNLCLGFVENLWFNVFSGRLTQLLCLFILGMQLGRQRLFYDEGRHLRSTRRRRDGRLPVSLLSQLVQQPSAWPSGRAMA